MKDKSKEMDWEKGFWDAWNNPKGEGIKRHERVKAFIRTAINQAISQEQERIAEEIKAIEGIDGSELIVRDRVLNIITNSHE